VAGEGARAGGAAGRGGYFLFGARFRGHSHPIGFANDARAALHGVDLRELGAEEEDLGRVVDPKQEDDQRAGGAVGGADAAASQVVADQDLADGEEDGG
jgi:hypothetical protein